MHILIAPNAFKHALDAKAAALAIQSGLLASKLACSCECFPIGDGGNGTCRLIVDRCRGEIVNVSVQDPLGRPITAPFGLIAEGLTAVIEMADASGLHLLKPEELDPGRASSYGTGELIKAALDKGVRKIIIGMGGSATVDGGSGILAALGARMLDKHGRELIDLPTGLEKLHAIDCASLDKRLKDCEITILCDVANPLLGENGAAKVFGPQKGASPQLVERLERMLQRYAGVIRATTGQEVSLLPSGGVAGGASAGLAGLVGARLVNGIDYFLELTRFNDSLSDSRLVVTGEGSIDSQTLHGKGPYGVAKRAKQAGIPVIGLAGQIPVDDNADLARYFDVLMAIGNGPSRVEEALPLTARNLTRTACQLGNLLSVLPI